jgi:hypothetical protein
LRVEGVKEKRQIKPNVKDAEEFAEERKGVSLRPSRKTQRTSAVNSSKRLLHFDIHNLAAKGAQDLLDGGVLRGCLARLLFGSTRFFFR